MKIHLKAGENTGYETTIDAGIMTAELEGVYNGVGIKCDDGYFGIVQRNGGIEVMKDGESVFPLSFIRLRKAMGEAILDDLDLSHAYQSNIAMLLHDNFDGADFKDPGVRNEAARMILQLIFRSGNDALDHELADPDEGKQGSEG